VRVTNGDPRHSDHRPIIIDVGPSERREWRRDREILPKFEAKWLEDYATRVEEACIKAMEEGNNTMQGLT
jgi:hypothetical protein